MSYKCLVHTLVPFKRTGVTKIHLDSSKTLGA